MCFVDLEVGDIVKRAGDDHKYLVTSLMPSKDLQDFFKKCQSNLTPDVPNLFPGVLQTSPQRSSFHQNLARNSVGVKAIILLCLKSLTFRVII